MQGPTVLSQIHNFLCPFALTSHVFDVAKISSLKNVLLPKNMPSTYLQYVYTLNPSIKPALLTFVL